MTNQPLNSNDTSKIMIFAILLLPIIVFGFGVIPLLFLVFGIYMMKKTRDFSHIETATKNFKIYMHLAFLVGVLSTFYLGNKYYTADESWYYDDEFYISFCLSFVPIIYLVFINQLFYKPLNAHKDWVIDNSFFSNAPNLKTKKVNTQDVNIIKGEKLKSYSVADELLKWAKLKEGGHISQEEYDQAREKLLKNT